MHQHQARAVVPGAYTFLSAGEFLRPHTCCHRAKGLEVCVSTPMYLIIFLSWFRELVLLDFVFFPILNFMTIIIFKIMHLLKWCHLTQRDLKCLHTCTLTRLFLMPLTQH